MSDSSEANLNGDFSAFSPKSTSEPHAQALGHFLLDSQSPTGGYGNDAGTRYDASQLRRESVQQRVAAVRASSTPLLEAAEPLLRALSDMPDEVEDRDQASLLKQSLKNEITLFSVVCDEADLSWKKMAIVRYCICTALDEAAHARRWGMDMGWSQSNLLNHFEGDNDGGNKFFLLVGRLSMSPQEYADVLEILLRIMGLGFEGRYSIIENGERQLTKIRQRLLTLLQSTRDSTVGALSVHALPQREVKKQQRFFVPVRVSLLFAGVLVVSSFITFKYLLMVPQGELLEEMKALMRQPEAQPVSAPVAPERLRLAILLKAEIAQKLVSVDETAGNSKVTFRGDSMFRVGAVSVKPEMLPVLKRVAEEIQRVKGSVVVVGYTDSTPINRPGLPNNQVLSEKRAASVAQLLQQAGIPADRIRFEGRGEGEPLASNDTAEGRAQNRRVEISVTY
ncbi:type VI secretion system protein TssL, long form [Serratia sp. UGAL515B_01]|uniref:type VI secretion system protein TssL, long form n=1 Tax=Serratia sp. UGAL515B_01 TaxID=2986763 RepID=UPI002955A9DE|nr:type VI secretion system protein TssL, long form [Serratia sp. UGAL515B_01]WON77488.1 type VI secretion system protein TssL, long form [Serratia sp. UGAL515B_01]WON77508.1 type VI secretion system protein TssL, long form [Serratia sp. UGAL515B_01]